MSERTEERLLLHVTGSDAAPAELPRAGMLVIGSSREKAGLVVDGQGVADVHCAIGRTKRGGWALKDLGSDYGTFLNGERIEQARLRAGDRILIGSRRLEVVDPERASAATKPAPSASASPSSPAAASRPAPAEPAAPLPSVPGYRIVRPIGRGAMGAVFLAVQESLEREVALKVLPPRLARDEDFVRRFQAEARAAAALNHPNVVTVHDVGQADGRHYLTMEYMDRGSLEERVAKEGKLDWRQVLDVLHDAASGLVYAESRGIVHRDIKPANLMQNHTGATKIADLGLATQVEAEAQEAETGERKIFGTPHFISPEQVRGMKADCRSDLYSLGATAYRLLSGHTPFEGASSREILRAKLREDPRPLREFVPDLPNDVEALVARAMQRDPEARHPSASALLREVDALRSGPNGAGAPVVVVKKSRFSTVLAIGLVLAAAITFALTRSNSGAGETSSSAGNPVATPVPTSVDGGAALERSDRGGGERDRELAEARGRRRRAREDLRARGRERAARARRPRLGASGPARRAARARREVQGHDRREPRDRPGRFARGGAAPRGAPRERARARALDAARCPAPGGWPRRRLEERRRRPARDERGAGPGDVGERPELPRTARGARGRSPRPAARRSRAPHERAREARARRPLRRHAARPRRRAHAHRPAGVPRGPHARRRAARARDPARGAREALLARRARGELLRRARARRRARRRARAARARSPRGRARAPRPRRRGRAAREARGRARDGRRARWSGACARISGPARRRCIRSPRATTPGVARASPIRAPGAAASSKSAARARAGSCSTAATAPRKCPGPPSARSRARCTGSSTSASRATTRPRSCAGSLRSCAARAWSPRCRTRPRCSSATRTPCSPSARRARWRRSSTTRGIGPRSRAPSPSSSASARPCTRCRTRCAARARARGPRPSPSSSGCSPKTGTRCSCACSPTAAACSIPARTRAPRRSLRSRRAARAPRPPPSNPSSPAPEGSGSGDDGGHGGREGE